MIHDKKIKRKGSETGADTINCNLSLNFGLSRLSFGWSADPGDEVTQTPPGLKTLTKPCIQYCQA